MIDVDFDIAGCTDEEAKERAGRVRTLLENKYERDANKNDDVFLENLERYKEEIIEALSLPPEVMKSLRAEKVTGFRPRRR